MALCFAAIASAQGPRIDFDRLLNDPNLLDKFELRYSVRDNSTASDSALGSFQLSIEGDGRASLILWRPHYVGSLAPVCHSSVSNDQLTKLLELLRDTRFTDIHDDSGTRLEAAAWSRRTALTVKLGRVSVTKRNVHDPSRKHPQLDRVEHLLDELARDVHSRAKQPCELEAVPARPPE